MENKRIRVIVLAVTAALVLLGLFFMLRSCGAGERTRANAIAYVGSKTPTHWSGIYYSLDGTTRNTMRVKNGALTITTTTQSGVISITVQDKKGRIIFDEEDLGSATYQVEASGKVKVTIEAENHEGSFDIRG